MANYAETLDHNARMKKEPKPKLDHLAVKEAENDGHIVEHHMDRYEHGGPETHVFEAHDGPKPKIPKGHVLGHIAKHMHIPHEVMNEDRGIGNVPENEEGLE